MIDIKDTKVFKLIKDWEKNDINYCHWKSIDHVKEGYEGVTDLDILISSKDAKKAEQIAVSYGFVKFYTHPLRTYPGVSDLILYDNELNKFIHLHLHYQLVLADRWVKGFRFPFEEKILNRKVYLKEFETWIINPIDEFIMFVCRMPLKFKNPFKKEKVKKEIEEIKNRISSIDDFNEFVNYYPQSFIAFSKNIYNNKYDQKLEKLVKNDMYKYYLRMSKSKFILLTYIRYLYRVYVEIHRRKLNNYSFGRRNFFYKGITVAFIGMDGAGKTSGIDRNLKFFAKEMNIEHIFLGSGQSGAPWYRKLIFKLLGTKSNVKSKIKSDKKKKYPWYYLIWHILVLKTKIKRLKQIFYYNSSCKLVFVDRWPQTDIIGSFDGPKFQNIVKENFLENYISNLENELFKFSKLYYPDLVLKFNVSPENSIKRKPNDLSLEEAIEAEKNIKKIKFENSKIINIDANKTIEEIDKEIREEIWKIIQEKN